jgi:hypothetical protein
MKIYFEEYASNYLDSLVETLYNNEYFGFKDTAESYISRIYDFIYSDFENFPKKSAPKQLRSFGSNYIFYKTNQRTTWYIFFETNGSDYFITNIINNNCEEAKWL